MLLFAGEFPSNVTPWIQAARAFGLEPRMLELAGFGDGSGLGLERLAEELRRGVRLVAVSAVQFQTGLRMPLGEIGRLCHALGAELFVDGIQAVGAGPLDLSEVDYLVAGGHKWLLGIEGAGLVYVAPGPLERLVPRLVGWLGHEEGLRFLFEGPGHLKVDRPFKQDASVLEPGVSSAAGFAALEASVGLLAELGLETIHDHLQACHDALEPRLQALGWCSLRAQDPAARSGTLSFLPPAGVDLVSLPERLAAEGVAVTIPDGCLRLSPHWPNDLEEVPRVVAALRARAPLTSGAAAQAGGRGARRRDGSAAARVLPPWRLEVSMRSRAGGAALSILILLCGTAQADENTFELTVDATFEPAQGRVAVALKVRQPGTELRGLTVRMKDHWAPHYSGWEADGGSVEGGDAERVWSVPEGGGTLRYRIRLDHPRHGRAKALFDAHVEADWAVLQAEVLLPRPKWRTKKGAASNTLLQLRGPRGWLFSTPFAPKGPGLFSISEEGKTKVRPRGWIIGGKKLARRHASVAGLQLMVASPPGHAQHAADVFAFLREAMPPLLKVFGKFPARILVVSAGDPMWHGGVSGQSSVFLHAKIGVRQRDGTSTALHELVHVLTEPVGTASDGDWYIEGLPEYYCLEAQRRAGTMSEAEHAEHLAYMRERSRNVKTLRVKESKGETTQRAVLALYALDAKIRADSGGQKSLDDVAQVMDERLPDRTTASFLRLCEEVTGVKLRTFFAKEIP